MTLINKKLNAKIYSLFVGGLISGVFIKSIFDVVVNSEPLIKIFWFSLVPLFFISDFFIYLETGEEFVIWFLEKLGLNIE